MSDSPPDALGTDSSPLLEEEPPGPSCPQSPSCLPLQTNTGIRKNLEQEVIHYSFQSSFFDIFVLAFFRFSGLLLGYAVLRLQH